MARTDGDVSYTEDAKTGTMWSCIEQIALGLRQGLRDKQSTLIVIINDPYTIGVL